MSLTPGLGQMRSRSRPEGREGAKETAGTRPRSLERMSVWPEHKSQVSLNKAN